MSQDSLHLNSDAFPAYSLLDSYYDRDVTRLSDRGMASNMIGDRWSELATSGLSAWEGSNVQLPNGEPFHVEQLFRLDEISEIANVASKRKLQNPDFILVGTSGSGRILMAADAKFSIDTAKSPQVSAETLQALLAVGPLVTDHLPGLPVEAAIQDGIFVSPDMPLTHYVLDRTRGRLSSRVPKDSVALLPVAPVPFLKTLEGSRLLGTLASQDGFRDDIRHNMLLAMYYFRLVRACYGAYSDLTSPILGPKSVSKGNVEDLEQRTLQLAKSLPTSWDVVLHWDGLAEQVRRQRETVHAAMSFPITNKELRERVIAESELRQVESPSLNSVRKRIGAWYREQFDERIGVVYPPIADISTLVTQIHAVASDLEPMIPNALDIVIHEVLDTMPPLTDEADATTAED